MVIVGDSEEPGAGAPQLGQKWLAGGTSAEQRVHRAMTWEGVSLFASRLASSILPIASAGAVSSSCPSVPIGNPMRARRD